MSVADRATSAAPGGSMTSTEAVVWESASMVPSENFTVTMRSGLSATTFSRFTLTPPTCSLVFAAAGSSEKSSSPTTRSPAPRAKRNSVFEGPIDTMRSGRLEIATERPWKSVTLVGKAPRLACAEADGDAGARLWEVPQLMTNRSAKSRTKRRVISGSPFLAKVWLPRAEDQATRVRRGRRYGGGTLPESHRLRWWTAYSVVREGQATRVLARSCSARCRRGSRRRGAGAS